MPESVQINLRVNEEQKERWEEYMEDSRQFSSLSGLIRASVESEIAQEEEEGFGPSPGLNSDINELQEELSHIRNDVAWLRKQHQEEVDISDLAQEVFDSLRVLPQPTDGVTVPEGVEMDQGEYRRRMGAMSVVQPDDAQEATDEGRSPQTARAIAERVDTSPKRVHDAIDHLKDQFLPVTEVEIEGEVHYFKEE